MEAMTDDELRRTKDHAKKLMPAMYGGADQLVVVDLSPAAPSYDWIFGDEIAITTRFCVPLNALATNDHSDPARWHAIMPCPAALLSSKTKGRCTSPFKVVTVARAHSGI